MLLNIKHLIMWSRTIPCTLNLNKKTHEKSERFFNRVIDGKETTLFQSLKSDHLFNLLCKFFQWFFQKSVHNLTSRYVFNSIIILYGLKMNLSRTICLKQIRSAQSRHYNDLLYLIWVFNNLFNFHCAVTHMARKSPHICGSIGFTWNFTRTR